MGVWVKQPKKLYSMVNTKVHFPVINDLPVKLQGLPTRLWDRVYFHIYEELQITFEDGLMHEILAATRLKLTGGVSPHDRCRRI
jgi:hypothetical protein